MSDIISTDLLIVGGGFVGLSLAAALANSGLHITLLEAKPTSAALRDDRGIALSVLSQQFLQAIGAWTDALAAVTTTIDSIHVSEKGQCAFSRLHAQQSEPAVLGYVTSGHTLLAELWRLATANKALTVLRPAVLQGLAIHPETAVVTYEQGGSSATLQAQCVIGAEGPHSPSRKLMSMACEQQNYPHNALTAVVESALSHNNVAYERFTGEGALAFLPLQGKKSALVWTLPPAQAEELSASDQALFLEKLQRAFGYRLGRFLSVSKRASYPLVQIIAKRQSELRYLLLGSSAHHIHPLAGQGLNLSLRDVAVLAEKMHSAVQQGTDIGGKDFLQQYVEQRLPDQNRVIQATNKLYQLFTDKRKLVRVARAVGLWGFDLMPPLKNKLIQQATGWLPLMPKLLLGQSLQPQHVHDEEPGG